MLDGVALIGLFDDEPTPPDVDVAHERIDLFTGSASFSLHFGRGFSCEFPSSVTLTILIEHPIPSADAFVVAPSGAWTEPKPDTFFPTGKASLLV